MIHCKGFYIICIVTKIPALVSLDYDCVWTEARKQERKMDNRKVSDTWA